MRSPVHVVRGSHGKRAARQALNELGLAGSEVPREAYDKTAAGVAAPLFTQRLGLGRAMRSEGNHAQ